MGRSWRWFVAAGVVLVAFAVPAVVCGVWVLPPLIKDVAARWAVATAVGAALAALAVLWGQNFASPTRPTTPSVTASGTRAIAVGGSVTGAVLSTGDHTTPPPPAPPAPAAPATPAPPPPPGSVTASGDRSIAIGGDFNGTATTGDHPGGPTP
ncbi:hypothetical protein ACIA8O_30745 [Kitasatospora sp. NPDC051853]|uniref:hypothetical protein n=1 Tax=Kitasatospora sp. NPDC051853 TaxID=3364058 RepID=UPI003791355B